MSDKYTYKALDQNRNRIVKGTAQASNEYALEQMLSESNLALISFKKINKSALNFAFLERITRKEMKISDPVDSVFTFTVLSEEDRGKSSNCYKS